MLATSCFSLGIWGRWSVHSITVSSSHALSVFAVSVHAVAELARGAGGLHIEPNECDDGDSNDCPPDRPPSNSLHVSIKETRPEPLMSC